MLGVLGLTLLERPFQARLLRFEDVVEDASETLPGETDEHLLFTSAWTGRVLKRYELLEEIGRGGMAVVFRALDRALEREVAVKLLHPHLATRAESARRFVREAKAVAKLHHPYVLEIFDFSNEDESEGKFIVTELIRGATLRDFVERYPTICPELGVCIGLCLCSALAHAHELGIIHRDIKPENVMIRDDGRIKLMDFGIAHVLDADRMTASGSLLGSPAHMPPEVIDGKGSGIPGDIFSLGTVLYYLTTNTLPFIGVHPTAVLRNIIDSRYTEPSQANPRISRGLDAIIRRCLAREPEQRYQQVTELAEALEKELATLELAKPESLAQDYLKDPEGFAPQFRAQLEQKLLQQARESVHRRETLRAVDLLNRLLDYEPEHSEALQLLQALRSRRRGRLFLLLGAGLCSLVLMGYGALQLGATSSPIPGGLSWSALDAAPTRPERVPVARPSPHVPALEQKTPPEPSRQPLLDALQVPLLDGFILGSAGMPRPFLVSAPLPPREVQPVARPLDEPTEKPIETPEQLRVRLDVYPFDTVAELKGMRYEANEDGSILLALVAGEYEVKLSCERRCQSKRVNVTVSKELASDGVITLSPISMAWSPGLIVIEAPKARSVYFVARRDNELSFSYMSEAARGNHISGFNALGAPIDYEIFAIPTNVKLDRLTLDAVEQAAYDSVLVKVGPGERQTATFR
jgi:serine/threonine-protein kinase